VRRRLGLTRATHHQVVPQGYVVLSELSGHTLRECERADAHNRALYERRVECVRRAGPGLSCDRVEEPPSPDNTARFTEYMQRNMPIEADRQARAVEALAAAGFCVGRDYAPHRALEFMRAHGVAHTAGDAPAEAMQAAEGGGALPRYTLFSDDELRYKSKRECIRTDRMNNEIYRRASRRCRAERKRLGSIARVHMDDMSQSKQSNYQRKIRLKSRDTLVSALEQAAAVQELFLRGLRLYVDYEPENAIALRAHCDLLPPPAPTPAPEGSACERVAESGPTEPLAAVYDGDAGAGATPVLVRALAWPPASVKPASHTSL
jgi:hypothetical protein